MNYKNEVVNIQTDTGEIALSNQIVRETLAIGSNITDVEIYNFMMLCKYRNLNPFLKEAYIVKYGENIQILVGKDAMIKRLHNNQACEGWEAGIIAWDSEDGKLIEREGSFFLKKEELVGAYCIIYRKGWKNPYKWTIALRDYLRTHKNKAGQFVPMGNWATMPGVMLTKCVIVATIRNVFPEDVGGCYTEDEIGVPADAIDVTPVDDGKIKENKKKEDQKKKEPGPVSDEKIFIDKAHLQQLCISAKSKKVDYNPDDLLSFAMNNLVAKKLLKSTSKREITTHDFPMVLDYVKKLVAKKELEAQENKEPAAAAVEENKEPVTPDELPIKEDNPVNNENKKENDKESKGK